MSADKASISEKSHPQANNADLVERNARFLDSLSKVYHYKSWRPLGSGKVRELYVDKEEKLLLMHTTDRVSAFDKVLPQPIPHKGAVLNQLNEHFLKQAAEIVPTWMIGRFDAQLMLGHYVPPLPVECIVRGHLSGHAWRCYAAGERRICGQPLANGLYPHAELPEPIFTPTTKADIGEKDQDLSIADILREGLLSKEQLQQLEAYSFALYAQGAAHAQEHGLRLLDAKYEFGLRGSEIYLIDELHTPDSARYCYEEEYQSHCSAIRQGEQPRLRQLSKEQLREHLLKTQQAGRAALLNPTYIAQLSKLYTDIYERLTKKAFKKDYQVYSGLEEIERALENHENYKKDL